MRSRVALVPGDRCRTCHLGARGSRRRQKGSTRSPSTHLCANHPRVRLPEAHEPAEAARGEASPRRMPGKHECSPTFIHMVMSSAMYSCRFAAA